MSRIDTLREELGGANPRSKTKVKDFLDEQIQGFVRHSPFAVMSSSNADGDCDASPKGGLPGFIKVVDERTLLVPDIGGNRLFQTYQNFESNPKAGLVFLIPGMDTTARINGRVEVVERQQLAAQGIEPELLNPDGNSGLVQGILVHVDEAYLHCPRSFRFAELWNAETIAANAELSLKDLREAVPS
ncbi:MAG: pyridoxamine 5'-phosphate oxidase family protein [Gammaproteobacteria bacterium]|nr:pyridoxamine 5'-phosphate oxidase family protein [Gammaproteobacteria bacterium]